jgi:hypothetical protein
MQRYSGNQTVDFAKLEMCYINSKVILVTGRGVLQGCEMLTIPVSRQSTHRCLQGCQSHVLAALYSKEIWDREKIFLLVIAIYLWTLTN